MRAYKARLRDKEGSSELETCALTKRAYGGHKEGSSELETDTKVNTELCAANGFCFNPPAAEAHYA